MESLAVSLPLNSRIIVSEPPPALLARIFTRPLKILRSSSFEQFVFLHVCTMAFSTEQRGSLNTLDFRLFFSACQACPLDCLLS